ncbi:MAG: hypothetical protein M3530_11730 [Thermoproteota archaeon]|nr:hypothetical protein [Thermoproteota archaeon]
MLPPSGAESNTTLDRPTAAGLTVPSVVEYAIPVNSFDIRITSVDGQELFKNQMKFLKEEEYSKR